MLKSVLESQKSLLVNSFLKKLSTLNRSLEENSLINQDFLDIKSKESTETDSLFPKCEEDVSYIAPYLKPSFNLAAYVNKSETLQELLKMGVDLHKIEKSRNNAAGYILGLNFENNIKNHIIFLHDLGLNVDVIADVITKNPFIFQQDLDDCKCRINYLKYKRFNDEMITRILNKNAMWLNFSSQEIDKRLGSFQKEFSLTGNEVRLLTTKKPRLITYNWHHIKVNTFAMKEEMGFEPEELKSILLAQPALFMLHPNKILKTFEFLHKNMNIPLEEIARCPGILTSRESKLKERYMFLKKLNKVQFNPKEPNFISVLSIVSGTDSHFATEVAKSSVQAYNAFLKSL